MKKLPLLIIVVIAISLFAAADYYLNNMDAKVVLEFKGQQVTDALADKDPVTEAPAVNSLFQLNEMLTDYRVDRQVQTRQIFEKIDLSGIDNITIYQNNLGKGEGEDSELILLYEIQGPARQGSLTYLNVKLRFIAQINAVTETINEDSSLGHNSFFFNDQNYQNSAFVLTQIGDNLFGFQYNKSNPSTYEDVKAIIESLMPAENL